MAEGDFKISQLSDGKLTPNSVFVTADYVNGEWVTQSHLASEMASKMFNSFAYTQELETTDKKPVGAINEVSDRLGVLLEGVLEAGQTTLTFTNDHITTNSWLDFQGEIYPVGITYGAGSLTMTFDEYSEDKTVKVVVF